MVQKRAILTQNFRNTPNLYYLAAASSSSCENDGSDGSYFGRNNLTHARHFPTQSTAGVVGFLANTTSANSPYTSAQSVCDTLLSEPYYKTDYNNYYQSDYYHYQQLSDFQSYRCSSPAQNHRRYSSREIRNNERSMRLLPTGS